MYFCRNCGLRYISDEAVVCVRCQAPKGLGSNFCPCCGAPAGQMQKVCMNCGVEMERYGVVGVKSKVCAGLLGIFLGTYGVHNFYLGYTKKAVIQLVLSLSSILIYLAAVIGLAVSETSYHTSNAMVVVLIIAMIYFVVAILGVRIWSFVEGIMILCGKIDRDGKGRFLK